MNVKNIKSFYIPGMLTSLALPVLMYFFVPANKPVHNCVRMYLPSDNKGPGYLRIFSK
jgi:hypothetical protein